MLKLCMPLLLADGSFVPLLIRLEHVIEHNVAIDSLIQSKRIFIEQVDRIAELTSSIIGLTKAQAAELIRTLGVLLVGASSTDQGPSLDNEELPDDVQNLIASFSPEPLFIKNAVRIIDGIRREARIQYLNESIHLPHKIERMQTNPR